MTDPVSPDNPYSTMQRAQYEREALLWTPFNRDVVVGSFDAHNAWPDYERLFDCLPADTSALVGLDLGCGPGRNLVRYHGRFKRLDGADIALGNLVNAQRWLLQNGVPLACRLYQIDGVALTGVPDATYDFVLSTITLQHVCVRQIRLALMRDCARVLQPGGWLTAQMGYGDAPDSVDYYADQWDAPSTNRGCDTRVESLDVLQADVEACGFGDFRAVVRPTGPGDSHANWVYFSARTPA